MEVEQIITLIKTVSESELTGVTYEENGVKLRLSKKSGKLKVVAGGGADDADIRPAETGSEAGSAGSEEMEPEGKVIESPLVGIFYTSPAEDAEPFVKVGDTVAKGQTVAIIEAMKLMNEIESEYDGTVAEVLAENGQPVEYGQPLFRIC